MTLMVGEQVTSVQNYAGTVYKVLKVYGDANEYAGIQPLGSTKTYYKVFTNILQSYNNSSLIYSRNKLYII
ncbi:MAG TPA: hypothetical protein DHN29_11245 [Cytophagales bacterium]|nr:hypothetical protein [Cytophagales bacterium]